MSHIDAVEHAAEHFARVDSYQEAMEREVARLKAEFIDSVMTKTLTDKAGFGNTYAWNGIHSVRVDACVLDVLMDAIDHRDNYNTIFNTLLLCAKKGDVDALAAIDKLAESYADMHAEVDE